MDDGCSSALRMKASGVIVAVVVGGLPIPPTQWLLQIFTMVPRKQIYWVELVDFKLT